MAIEVTIDYLYIHRADTPATFLNLELDALTEVSNRDGRIEVLAGGRRRSVFTEGYDKAIEITCEQVSRADVDVFRAWAEEGAFLYFREPRGRIVWGHIMSPSFEEISVVDKVDVRFSIREVTYSEAV